MCFYLECYIVFASEVIFCLIEPFKLGIYELFPELERDNVLLLLRKSASVEGDPYDEESIFEESEMMNVGLVGETANGGNADSKKASSHLDSKGLSP